MTTGTTTTIEAEDMTISGGYQAKHWDGASGGGYVQTWSHGALTTTFEGLAGTYSLDLTAFDENDGQSVIEVWVNGALIQSLVLDEDAGGGYLHGTSRVLSVDGITLAPGDRIELRGYSDQGEAARIDKIDLTQTGGAGQTVTLMLEEFEKGQDLTRSANVLHSDFIGSHGTAASNACYDGTLLFRQVDLSGLSNGLVMLDLGTDAHCAYFEDSTSQYYDYLRVEVSIDGGAFTVLDDFEVDYHSQIFYGKQTGQSFGGHGSTLSYALPEGAGTAQLRIVSHLSAKNEVFRVDNVKITAQEPESHAPEPPAIDAIDDAIELAETQDITADGTATELGEAPKALNLLDNDDTDGVAVITALAGAPGAEIGTAFTVTTEGGRTGTVTIGSDGTMLFDGGDNFRELVEGETDRFQLDYTLTREIPASETRVIGFDSLAAGDIASMQFDGVTIRAERAGHAGEANRAMIFDTANPTGGDWDLATSNLGNVLIISEDLDSADPDDNAHGGTITVTFDQPSMVNALTFLDTEEPRPEIRLFDATGAKIGGTIFGPVTADGGQAVQQIGVAGVARMEITLKGSGAIDNLDYALPTTETLSDTATVTVVINGEGTNVPPVELLPPVAVDDTLTTTDTADITGVNIITAAGAPALGADTDPDAPQDQLRVVSANGESIAPGTAASFQVTNGAGQSGTVTVDDLGNLTFTDAQGFEGGESSSTRFSFDYVIADADGLLSSATVTIDVTDTTVARTIQLSGSVQSTLLPGSQGLAIILDASIATDLVAGAGADLNNDGSVTAMDSFLAGTIALAQSLVDEGRGDQTLTLIPVTAEAALPPVTATASALAGTDFAAAAADPANPLNDDPLVQAVFAIRADGLAPSIDFEQGLLAARDALTDATGAAIAQTNEVLILTASDGLTLEIAEPDGNGGFVVPDGLVLGRDLPGFPIDGLFEDDLITSDPTAAAAELRALGADIDVLFTDPDGLLFQPLLDLAEGAGDGAVATTGIPDLAAEISPPPPGQLAEVQAFSVAVNGQSVAGIDASDLIRTDQLFTLAATDLSVLDGDQIVFSFTTEGVDLDGDGDFTTSLTRTVDAATDSLGFVLDLEAETAFLV